MQSKKNLFNIFLQLQLYIQHIFSIIHFLIHTVSQGQKFKENQTKQVLVKDTSSLTTNKMQDVCHIAHMSNSFKQ